MKLLASKPSIPVPNFQIIDVGFGIGLGIHIYITPLNKAESQFQGPRSELQQNPLLITT